MHTLTYIDILEAIDDFTSKLKIHIKVQNS